MFLWSKSNRNPLAPQWLSVPVQRSECQNMRFECPQSASSPMRCVFVGYLFILRVPSGTCLRSKRFMGRSYSTKCCLAEPEYGCAKRAGTNNERQFRSNQRPRIVSQASYTCVWWICIVCRISVMRLGISVGNIECNRFSAKYDFSAGNIQTRAKRVLTASIGLSA